MRYSSVRYSLIQQRNSEIVLVSTVDRRNLNHIFNRSVLFLASSWAHEFSNTLHPNRSSIPASGVALLLRRLLVHEEPVDCWRLRFHLPAIYGWPNSLGRTLFWPIRNTLRRLSLQSLQVRWWRSFSRDCYERCSQLFQSYPTWYWRKSCLAFNMRVVCVCIQKMNMIWIWIYRKSLK